MSPKATENLLVALVAVAAFALGFGPVLWRHFQRVSVLNNGVPAQAKVLELHPTNRLHNNERVVRIRLQVTGSGGRQYVGEVTMPLSAARVPQVQPGAQVAVRYLPDSPQRIAIDFDRMPLVADKP